MSWEYSDLSHEAKQAGGPENFIRNLAAFHYNKGVKAGKHEQSLVDFTVVGFVVVGYVVYKIIRKSIAKPRVHSITEAETREAKSQFVQIISDTENENQKKYETTEDFKRESEKDEIIRCQEPYINDT